jgi:hypothetical protein
MKYKCNKGKKPNDSSNRKLAAFTYFGNGTGAMKYSFHIINIKTAVVVSTHYHIKFAQKIH